MSKIADTFNELGFLPLQHKGCVDQGWDIATMDSVLCVRSLGRERTGDNAGVYGEDPDARGNLGGAVCWQVPRSSVRKIAMWNFAFASVVVGGGKSTSSGSAFTVSGASATGSEDYACLPIRDEIDTPDTRFSTLVIRRPGGHPKYPLGTLGVVLGTTEENRQVERFLHCDPRLIAVNAGGDPGMGSLVCDLTPENKIDDNRTAPLQSAFRVLKLPGGAVDDLGDNFLAFQLSNSGRGDTGGGFVYDAAAGDVIGQLSKMFSGFIDVGGAFDQHKLGTDADGHPINAAHFSEEAYLRSRDGARDGPLKFDGNYVPCPRAPYLTQTFWTWDGSLAHDFVLGSRAGKYRWEGTSYKYEPSTPTPPPTTGKPPTEVPPPKPPPDEPTGGPPGKGKPPTKEPPPDKPPVPSGGGDTGTPGGGWPEPPLGPPPGGTWPGAGLGGSPPLPGGPGSPGGPGPPGAGIPPGPGGAPPGGGVPLPGAAPGGTIRVGVGRRGGGFGGWWQGLRRVWGGLVGFGPGGRPGANWVPPPPGRDPNAGAALGNRVRKLDLRPRGPRAPGVPPNPLDPNAGRDKVGPPVNSPGFGGGDLGLKGGIPPSALPPAPRTLAPVGRLPNTYSGVPAAGAPVVGARGPGEYRRVTAEPIETLHGPISFRPQDQRPGTIDFRNWMTPEFQAMRVMDHTTPVVCRLEPYGAQGGTAGVGPLLGAAAAGDPWVKNFAPGTRYPGGTAAGGLVFLPPEVTLTDLMLDADGVTKSAGYFTFAPGTYLALGTPDLATGGIISGQRWSEDSSGNTVLENVNASGVATEVLRIDSNGNLGIGTGAPATQLDVALGFAMRATSPAQITSNQNNYNPGSGSFFRLSTDASRTITGLAGGVNGRYLTLANVGSNPIVLANQSASSDAANRIVTGTGANITLAAGETIQAIYDATDSRWRCKQGAGSSALPQSLGTTDSPTFAANTLTGSTPVTVSGGSGADFGLKSATELLTIAAAATTDTTFSLPAGATILAASLRVVTVIPTATSFYVTAAAGGTTLFAGVAVAAGTTDLGQQMPYRNASGVAQILQVVPDNPPAAGTGQVRFQVLYLDATAPTS